MTVGSCGIRCSRSGLRRISLSAPTADSCGYLHQFQCFFSVGISNTPCRKKAPRSKRAFPRSPLWHCQRLPFPLSADRPVRRDSSFQGDAPAENRKKMPQINSILVEKRGQDMACGAIGIGEITTIPTAPAVAGAYFALDGEMRCSLPLMKTPYERPKMPRYWW